jgi:hypothetical protein
VQTDWIQFSNALAAAIDMRTVFEGAPSGFNAHGFVPRGGGRPEASEQQSCKKCDGRCCPHIDGRSQCDVHNNVSQARAREVLDIPYYKGLTRGGSTAREQSWRRRRSTTRNRRKRRRKQLRSTRRAASRKVKVKAVAAEVGPVDAQAEPRTRTRRNPHPLRRHAICSSCRKS